MYKRLFRQKVKRIEKQISYNITIVPRHKKYQSSMKFTLFIHSRYIL